MSLLHIDYRDRILTLTMRDQKNGNSLSLAQAESLERAVNGREASCAGLVLQADGRLFCAGGNLRDYAAMATSQEGIKANRRIRETLDHVAKLSLPTVAAVTGDCFGGGLELLSAFDRVIAAPHVLFGFWQRKVGLSFGWGGGGRLAARLGEHRLRALALEARVVGAYEALDLGLIDQIVSENRVREESRTWIARAMGLPLAPVGRLKSWTPANEVQAFESLWWNEEHRAALKKFTS